jgi:ACS family hexuronate transporter-like MFS transporter
VKRLEEVADVADVADVARDAAAPRLPLYSRRRWLVLGMLFASTILNYVDRQTLSILADHVQRDLGMSVIDYAHVVQLFLIAYTLAYLGAG